MSRSLLAFLLSFSSLAFADLNQKLNEELTFSSVSLSAYQKTFSNRHVIMWAGFRNELIGDYFEDNILSLNNDFLIGKVSLYEPSSAKHIAVVAQESYSYLMNMYRAGGNKPLILFSHSKGGAEALLTLIEYPQLITSGIVDRFISVQGSIGGTPLSDMYNSSLRPVLPLFLGPFIDFLDDGLLSIGQREAHYIFDTLIAKLTSANRDALTKRIFYVRSQQSGSALFRIFKFSGRMLKPYGPNDGAVLTQDMYRPDLGIDLGIIDADHGDLVSGPKHSNQSHAFKQAFTRAVFREAIER